jgi:hypothetical protein
LEPVKRGLDGTREGVSERGFADARHILNEEVALGNEADKGQAHDIGLAPNGRAKQALQFRQLLKSVGKS